MNFYVFIVYVKVLKINVMRVYSVLYNFDVDFNKVRRD